MIDAVSLRVGVGGTEVKGNELAGGWEEAWSFVLVSKLGSRTRRLLLGAVIRKPEENASPVRTLFSKRQAFQDQCTRQVSPARIRPPPARDFPEAYPASRR
jgi:hypothetical protein